MSDVTWTLSLREAGNGSDTEVTVNGLRGEVLEATPTNRGPVTLDFASELSGEDPSRDRFETARKLLVYAHQPIVGLEGDYLGVPWYREELAPDSPVESQVIKLSPESRLTDLSLRGVWAVVIGGQKVDPALNPKLELDLFVLGEDGDYADRVAVETALGESI